MKIIRGFALFLAVLMVFSCVLLAGCQTNQPQMQYEIASYQGQLAEGQTKSDYNSELFYRNDKKGFDRLVRKNMKTDFSWNVSVKKYLKVYRNKTFS